MINANFLKKEGIPFLRHVKISVFLMLFCVPSMFAEVTYAQRLLPTINLDNVTINRVFNEIEKGSDYVFLITDEIKPQLERKVTVKTENSSVTTLLDQILANSGLAYVVTGNQIAVYKQAGTQNAALQQQPPAGITISGTVVDEDGKTIQGVTITLKSNRRHGVISDVNGRYSIVVPNANETLLVSCVGMKPREVTLKPGITVYNVKMESAEHQLEEVRVVSTGMFLRDKTSFTGAMSSFTRDEIKQVGTRNVLQSLSVLDPSFMIVDNISMGSNPNSMPTIELRGQASASLNSVQDEFSADPNQPLFVLNGVIVKIDRINDIDINRIESVTILKDAGSTAIYGSKGANGVVVIETMKPRPGEYKIYYSGLFSADGPDLSVYNMMNSSEKLEFERLARHYNHSFSGLASDPYVALAKQQLYDERLARIARGVDTYWLAEPVRTAFSHEHSLRVTGGSEELAVEVGGKIGNIQGVMKGSGRETWAGNIMLNYRANRLLISNYTDITGYTATGSPYGDFSDWVDASPYYEKRDEYGRPTQWLQEQVKVEGIDIVNKIPNPLWNAGLNNLDETINFNVSNSLLMQYQVSDYLMIKGAVDLMREHKTSSVFVDSRHTDFADVESRKQGTFEGTNFRTTKYNAYLQSYYGRTLNDVHTIGANVRVSIGQTMNTYLRTKATGFFGGSKGSPNTAETYEENSKPGYFLGKQREVGVVAAFNYDYDRRYLLDFNYSLNGSTTFGSNKLFKPFWGVGIGWNINREAFASDWKWADLLKLRANIGTAGNQNIGQVTSTSVYQIFLPTNIFGQGTYIESLGNPNLPWQVTKDINVGLDLRTLGGRLSFTTNVYQKKTDPLIVLVPQVPSTGLKEYPMHLGAVTVKGLEWILAYSPIYYPEERIIWNIRFTGIHSNGKYSGFGNKMDSFNKTMSSSSELRRYKDGFSPTDIWAVRSGGIDPATGQEIYIKKDGKTLTFLYDAEDQVRVGNERPDVSGTISTSLRYKNFNFYIAMSYSIGGDIYNYALYNKVENITKSAILKNQDKRALYDRWKNVGDHAEFRSIEIVSSISSKTSRFVQKNNYLRASQINLTYDINQNQWLKKNIGVELLTLRFEMNELFRFETSKTERGTLYPFARKYTLGISANF